jgi:hypothetical protein
MYIDIRYYVYIVHICTQNNIIPQIDIFVLYKNSIA